jgi:magnesium chelatase family protein
VLARALSGAVLGVDAYPVIVEADVASGLPSFSTVGLPQGAVKEGRERVISAVQNSGYLIPPKRITINLAPAGATKAKRGSGSGRAPGRAGTRRWSALMRLREGSGRSVPMYTPHPRS